MAVYPGEGTTLSYSSDGTSYTPIAQVVSINGPSWAVAEVETTHLTSTDKEFRPSEIPESGTLDFSIEYDADSTTHSAMTTLMATPATRYWQIGLNDTSSTTWSGQGFLTGFSLTGMEVEGNLMADVSLRFTGGLTIA